MSYKLRRPAPLLKVKTPSVILARQMEEMMHEAGMPKGCSRKIFSLWHDRLYASDEVYRAAHQELLHLLALEAKRAKEKASQ